MDALAQELREPRYGEYYLCEKYHAAQTYMG
jgi:hypothetical protein